MARYDTAVQIINQAASECGLTAVSDPYASSDPAFIQMRNILNSAGQELLGSHEWQKMVKNMTINTTTTVPPDPLFPNRYDLPDDFSSMIDQTGWTPTNAGMGLPLGGPLTPQDWTYLVATNLANSTIYVSFRQNQGQFWVLPDPPPPDVDITFEYMSRNWAISNGGTEMDSCSAADDIVWFEPILIKKLLKLRFLEAKGFDTTSAVTQFANAFMQWTGKDLSAPVLSMARNRVFPYLSWRNVPQTNFGLP
jgi:hypothetical protein